MEKSKTLTIKELGEYITKLKSLGYSLDYIARIIK